MYKNKKGGIVGIIITIIILIIIVLLTNVEINKVSGLEKAFDTIVTVSYTHLRAHET